MCSCIYFPGTNKQVANKLKLLYLETIVSLNGAVAFPTHQEADGAEAIVYCHDDGVCGVCNVLAVV